MSMVLIDLNISDECLRYLQRWRIRDFEGARAPPERTSAPPHRQKHPLKIKEKLCKIPCATKIEQKYGYLRLNLGK